MFKKYDSFFKNPTVGLENKKWLSYTELPDLVKHLNFSSVYFIENVK